MTIHPDVFRAILALDAYNRGTTPSLNISGNRIGDALLADNVSDIDSLQADALTANFSAQAYTLNGKTIISYRGTDNISQDAQNAYLQALGVPDSPQTLLAIKFLNEVQSQVQTGEIELTGHSLGGGLAGYIGSLFGLDATIFNNMAFEDAAQHAYDMASIAYDQGPNFVPSTELEIRSDRLHKLIYGEGEPWTPLIGNNLKAYATAGEGLNFNRLDQDTPVIELYQNSGIVPWDAHSQALLTILLYGEKDETNTQWEAFRDYFVPYLFNETIATKAYAADVINEANNEPLSSVDNALRTAIAYSAIDSGTMPFGDKGIRALFNDAEDIGKVIIWNESNILADALDPIAKAMVQFAGQLALAEHAAYISDDSLKQGILQNVNSTLILDLSDHLWQNNRQWSRPDIVAEDELKATYFSHMGGGNALPSDIQSGMTKLWGSHSPTIIDRLVYRQSNDTLFSTIADRAYDSDKVTLFATDTGVASIKGSSGKDLLYGANGDDTFYGGYGKDLLRGGAGNDSLFGQENDDYLLGGDGNDVLSDQLGDNTLDGGAGNDLLMGGEGLNTLIGGAGNDTFVGAKGTLIQAIDDEKDVIHFSHGIGVEADTEDEIHFHGRILHGGLAHGNEVSDAAMAYDANGLIRYSMNHVGELIVENVLGWKMFIKDYVGGPGVTNPTAGINVAQITWSAYSRTG